MDQPTLDALALAAAAAEARKVTGPLGALFRCAGCCIEAGGEPADRIVETQEGDDIRFDTHDDADEWLRSLCAGWEAAGLIVEWVTIGTVRALGADECRHGRHPSRHAARLYF